MTQQGICNTKIKCPSRSRNYCFTLNNYTKENITHITQLGCDYVFQEETGSNGTRHLQGIVMFKNAISFNKLKRMLPTAHLEVCKNKIASIHYCSKSDTRTGKIFTNIKLPKKNSTIDTAQIESKENQIEEFENYKNELRIKSQAFLITEQNLENDIYYKNVCLNSSKIF